MPEVVHAEPSVIRHAGDRVGYRFEAEPHGIVGLAGPFQRATSLGIGFRGTFIIVDNGFIKSINNSVGIGVGADFALTRSSGFVPVVMQWNFFLTPHWSVFGEPGLGLGVGSGTVVHPAFFAGGRFHFTDRIALTMRVGYPAASVGASFFF